MGQRQAERRDVGPWDGAAADEDERVRGHTCCLTQPIEVSA
jgi:hypothetical protein